MSNVGDGKCKRVNDTVGILSYKAPRGYRVEISECGRIWKKVIIVYVHIQSQHLPRGNENNHEHMSV
jgi:ribosomal protein L21E